MIPFKKFNQISEALQWHLDNQTPLSENVFRVGSKSYFDLYREARKLYEEGAIQLEGWDKYLLEETDIGTFAIYEDKPVPLDCPMYKKRTKKTHL